MKREIKFRVWDKETLKALEEARKGEVVKYDSVDEMMEDLNKTP